MGVLFRYLAAAAIDSDDQTSTWQIARTSLDGPDGLATVYTLAEDAFLHGLKPTPNRIAVIVAEPSGNDATYVDMLCEDQMLE